MSIVAPVEEGLKNLIKTATGVTNMDYYGSTLAVSQESKGVVMLSSMSYEGTIRKLLFKVAIGFYAVSPAELKEKTYTAVEAIQLAFKSKGPGGICVKTLLGCANAQIGAISVNDVEGFAENGASSSVRHVKTSIGFEVTAQLP